MRRHHTLVQFWNTAISNIINGKTFIKKWQWKKFWGLCWNFAGKVLSQLLSGYISPNSSFIICASTHKNTNLMSFITMKGGKGWIIQHTASLQGGRWQVNMRHCEYLEDNLPLNETLLVPVMGNLQWREGHAIIIWLGPTGQKVIYLKAAFALSKCSCYGLLSRWQLSRCQSNYHLFTVDLVVSFAIFPTFLMKLEAQNFLQFALALEWANCSLQMSCVRLSAL